MLQVAIVFGATGISGRAMVNALVERDDIKKIIAVSRKEVEYDIKDSRVDFVSGLDFLKESVECIATKLKEHGADKATHAFHYNYIAKSDENELVDINKTLFQKALDVTAEVAPNLQVFVLQTGYKYYGVHKGGKYLAPVPFKEDAPRHEGLNFYFVQEDMLTEFAVKHGWKWLITRPNVILGPSKGNFMNFAVSVGLYAAVQKELGKRLVYPGNQYHYEKCLVDFSDALNNSRFQIFASTHKPNEPYNIFNGDKLMFKSLWPKIAEYFHLQVQDEFDKKAIYPSPDSVVSQQPLQDYMPTQHQTYLQMADKYSLDKNGFSYGTWDFVDFVTSRTWPDDGDLEKARGIHWNEHVDTVNAFYRIFDEMKKMNIIPK